MSTVSAGRGPSGRANFPPPDLNSHSLPCELWPAGTNLFRCHNSSRGAIFFGPGRGRSPVYRFDSASNSFGVLYVGVQERGALVETILRNPQFTFVEYSAVSERSISRLVCRNDLLLAGLFGPGLQHLGLTNDISTGPYEPCGAWSDALYHHPQRPDGIIYHSRHDPEQLCIALFERAKVAMRVENTKRLVDDLAAVRTVLRHYGKTLLPPP